MTHAHANTPAALRAAGGVHEILTESPIRNPRAVGARVIPFTFRFPSLLFFPPLLLFSRCSLYEFHCLGTTVIVIEVAGGLPGAAEQSSLYVELPDIMIFWTLPSSVFEGSAVAYATGTPGPVSLQKAHG